MANQPPKKPKWEPPADTFEPPADYTGCGQCSACDTPLGLAGGMAGTGLCGPCCTGDAGTLEEFGETW